MTIKIHIFTHFYLKLYIMHYKSIGCRIITQFYTLVNFYAFIDIYEHFDSIL